MMTYQSPILLQNKKLKASWIIAFSVSICIRSSYGFLLIRMQENGGRYRKPMAANLTRRQTLLTTISSVFGIGSTTIITSFLPSNRAHAVGVRFSIFVT
jgi:hypothetical protein